MGTREIRSADCYSARVSYCPRFTGVSPRYSRRSTTEARMKYERKKRGFKLSLPWFSVRLTASSRDHLRSLRFTLFSAVSLGDRREPVVAGKVTHDQGYPLLGAKGNDMEDRNLGNE